MKKTLSFIRMFDTSEAYLEHSNVQDIAPSNLIYFSDLAPVDDADQSGVYSRALDAALVNSKVKNIALTGPYGSGKSSIIKTYEKNRNYKFLNISLASFHEEDVDTDGVGNPTNHGVNDTDESLLVERSILQQMLYGADANDLPYSRFKRISTPERPFLKSVVIVLWLLAVFLIFDKRGELFKLENLASLRLDAISSWPDILLLMASIPTLLIACLIATNLYKSSFGYSLKKVSLKNAEIETGEQSEKSILNSHLDEIIYFFQVTDYDVVVIEDLDRFGNTEIFVKLREINKLINDNLKGRRRVKFLYALKDDMFENKDRTKFFDFIIPVVPIINSSNSLDKMRESLVKHNFVDLANSQFVREVSRYVDDMRLMNNLMNEFLVYNDLLNGGSLKPNKLLAMMIYKNIYPNDFENLHHNEGALFEVCQGKAAFIAQKKNDLTAKITTLRDLLERSKAEYAKTPSELKSIYIGEVMKLAESSNSKGLFIGGKSISWGQVFTDENYELLATSTNIQFYNTDHYGRAVPRVSNKSFAEIEKLVNANKTYAERKTNVENQIEEKLSKLRGGIRSLEEQVSNLTRLKLSELLQDDGENVDAIMVRHGIQNGKLLAYLLKNGYLDENYHQYISNFHEGRISRSDQDYLHIIRNFEQPDPDHRIDTPKEVCLNMRDEDFSEKYVLNINLLDYLLSEELNNEKRLNLAVNYVSENFEQAESFINAYYLNGLHLERFVKTLSKVWPNFGIQSLTTENAAMHISYILKYVDEEFISKNMNVGGVLTDYISKNGKATLASDIQIVEKYDVLEFLDVKFVELKNLSSNESLLDYVKSKNLYKINEGNIRYLITSEQNLENIDTADFSRSNYTTILKSKNGEFINYVNANLEIYVHDVLFSHPDYCQESEEAILALINSKEMSLGTRKGVIQQQEHIFGTFENIPSDLWHEILSSGKIEINWTNISDYFQANKENTDDIGSLLATDAIANPLSNSVFDKTVVGNEESTKLSSYIFQNTDMNDKSYCKLISQLPYRYKNLPTDSGKEKILCLLDQNVIGLNETSFKSLEDHPNLLAKLIANNISIYVKNKDEYEIDDPIRRLLILSNISIGQKLEILKGMQPDSIIDDDTVAKKVSDILLEDTDNLKWFDKLIVKAAIDVTVNSSSKVELLTMSLEKFDADEVISMISKFNYPIKDIAKKGRSPKVSDSQINQAFLAGLKSKGVISSYKKAGAYLRVYSKRS